jgi:hypothetical protein
MIAAPASKSFFIAIPRLGRDLILTPMQPLRHPTAEVRAESVARVLHRAKFRN